MREANYDYSPKQPYRNYVCMHTERSIRGAHAMARPARPERGSQERVWTGLKANLGFGLKPPALSWGFFLCRSQIFPSATAKTVTGTRPPPRGGELGLRYSLA